MNRINIIGFLLVAITSVLLISSCKDKRSRGLEYAPNMYYPIAYNPDQKNPYSDKFIGNKKLTYMNETISFTRDELIQVN